MQKKAKAPEPAGESAPMWIVSFADLVTLLMSFFVVLYALKQGGAQQQMETAAAIRTAFDPNYLPPADSNSEFDQMIRMRHGMPGPPYQNNGGNSPTQTDGATGRNQTVESIRTGKQIETGTKITFDLGDTSIDAASEVTISQIFKNLYGHTNVIFVKGHISADEVGLNPKDPDGTLLSNERAMKVIGELVHMGIDRRFLRPVVCGPYEPVRVGVYSKEDQRQNRRVEIFSTETTAADYTPINTVPAVAGARDKEP